MLTMSAMLSLLTATFCSRFSFLILLLVKCNEVSGSDKLFDRCGACGGNDSSCHVISGIFTRTQLPVGYNRVTSVPRGACNINITELVVSPNYLAIRETDGPYVVNGDRDVIGKSGEFPGAGTIFSYIRDEQRGLVDDDDIQQPVVETILAAGPLNTSIDIMVVQEQENRGIMYTYTLPAIAAADADSTAAQQLQPHRVRHHHRGAGRRHHQPQKRPDVSAAALDSSALADQPIIDVDDGALSAAGGSISELGPQPQQHHQQSGISEKQPSQQQQRSLSRSSPSSHQEDSATRRNRQHKNNRFTGDQNDNRNNSRKKHANDQVASDDPHVVATRDTVGSQGAKSRDRGGSGGAVDLRPQPGPNFGLSVGQPRYVGPLGGGNAGGRFHHSQSSYPAAGWPYTSSQQSLSPLLGSYQPNPAQYSPPAVGSPYYPAVRTPYVLSAPAQPYYLSPGNAALQDQQGPTYYSGAAGVGGGNHRRRTPRGQHGAPLNDQTAALGGNGGAYLPLGGAGGGAIQQDASDYDDDNDVVDYVWKIAGFSECSQTCGGGFQQTQVVCMKVTGTQVIVTDDNCDESIRPVERTVTCSNTPCPPSWETTEWSNCSTSCDRGQQTRSTECRQKVSPTLSIAVSASRCLHMQRPDTFRTCNDDKPCSRWKIGEWSRCSTECGRGQRTREVVCVNVEDKQIPENKCEGTKPRANELCDMGSCARTWFYTEWSTECSTTCGEGVHQRHVHCSADEQRCSEINRPKSEKPCKNERPCGGQWFYGPWSKCSVTCGDGVITRDVVCVKKLGALLALVGDENCQLEEKPETEQDCELDPCEPLWYMTEWSECSRTCDTGLRNREVKCLDADQQLSQSCDASTKPSLREPCNPQPCSSGSLSSSSPAGAGGSPTGSGSSSRRESGRNRQASSCQDKFKNCRVVVQARLCRYGYYKDVCCFSCISHGYEPATSSSSSSSNPQSDAVVATDSHS